MAKGMNFAPKTQPEMGKFPLRDKLAAALVRIRRASKKKSVLSVRDTQGRNGGIVKGAGLNKDLKQQFGTASSGRIK